MLGQAWRFGPHRHSGHPPPYPTPCVCLNSQKACHASIAGVKALMDVWWECVLSWVMHERRHTRSEPALAEAPQTTARTARLSRDQNRQHSQAVRVQ